MSNSVKLVSPVTSATAPFMFGVVMKKGEAPAGLVVDTPKYQVVVKRRWNDGSVKHAIVSGLASIVGGVPLTLGIAPGTGASGAALTSNDIAKLKLQGSWSSELGTVDLASAKLVRTWVAGPQMVECHYAAAVPGTPLTVTFAIRLWANGAKFAQVVTDNGFIDDGKGGVAKNVDLTYTATVVIDGKTLYSKRITHIKNTTWMAEAWLSADPQITPVHSKSYLTSTLMVPNYEGSNPNEATLAALVKTYEPMGKGAVPWDMASPGANPSIALLPAWNGNFMGTDDPRAYNAVGASSRAMGNFGLCWKDATTNDVLKPSAFASWSIYGPGVGGAAAVDASNGCRYEMNHSPGECYLAYLLTGDYWHYRTLLMQVATNYIMRGVGTVGQVTMGYGVNRIIVSETRGTAWAMRSMALFAAIAPDDELTDGAVAAEYRTLFANNIKFWAGKARMPGINQLGLLFEYSVNSYGPGWIAPWQQFWWGQSLGFGSDIEPLADMGDYMLVRDHHYQFVIGMAKKFYRCLSIYNMRVTSGTSDDPRTWGPTWDDVANMTFAHLPNGFNSVPKDPLLLNGGDMVQGNPVPAIGGAGRPEDAAFGRWGYVLPNLAYAVDHNAPGAKEVWQLITSAANYAALKNAGFDQNPQWGIFPRNAGATMPQPIPVDPAPTPVGLPVSAIPADGKDGASPLFKSLASSDAGKLVGWEIVSPVAHGDLQTLANGGFIYTPEDPVQDDSFVWKKRVNGVDAGDSKVFLRAPAIAIVPVVDPVPTPNPTPGPTPVTAEVVVVTLGIEATGADSVAITFTDSSGAENKFLLGTGNGKATVQLTKTITLG